MGDVGQFFELPEIPFKDERAPETDAIARYVMDIIQQVATERYCEALLKAMEEDGLGAVRTFVNAVSKQGFVVLRPI